MARGEGESAASAPLAVLEHPQISLVGDIDKFSVERFLDQLAKAEQAGGDIALEVMTEGGDPEMARRIVLEIENARGRVKGRLLFLGKTVVYSAGVTIMSALPCRDRWLSRDAILLIHGRKLDQKVEISGPIRASIPMVEALRSQMATAVKLEEQGFRRLIEGSDISLDELMGKALHNWYVPADEALERGLVAGIV